MSRETAGRRQHQMIHEAGRSKIEIEEPLGTGARWHVNLEAKRVSEGVDVMILGSLVVRFTRQEARDFALALERVAAPDA